MAIIIVFKNPKFLKLNQNVLRAMNDEHEYNNLQAMYLLEKLVCDFRAAESNVGTIHYNYN